MKFLELYSRIIDAISAGVWYWGGLFIGGHPIYFEEIITYQAMSGRLWMFS